MGVALTTLTALSATTWASVPESRIVFRVDQASTMTVVTARSADASALSRASTCASKQESLDVECTSSAAAWLVEARLPAPEASRMITGVAPAGRMFCTSIIWEIVSRYSLMGRRRCRLVADRCCL